MDASHRRHTHTHEHMQRSHCNKHKSGATVPLALPSPHGPLRNGRIGMETHQVQSCCGLTSNLKVWQWCNTCEWHVHGRKILWGRAKSPMLDLKPNCWTIDRRVVMDLSAAWTLHNCGLQTQRAAPSLSESLQTVTHDLTWFTLQSPIVTSMGPVTSHLNWTREKTRKETLRDPPDAGLANRAMHQRPNRDHNTRLYFQIGVHDEATADSLFYLTVWNFSSINQFQAYHYKTKQLFSLICESRFHRSIHTSPPMIQTAKVSQTVLPCS